VVGRAWRPTFKILEPAGRANRGAVPGVQMSGNGILTAEVAENAEGQFLRVLCDLCGKLSLLS